MNLSHTEKIALRHAGLHPRQVRRIQQQETAIVNMERKIEALMSEQEYDVEREKLREAYGDGRSSIEARAKADMALAKFFVETGWSRERLAKKEGASLQRISQRMFYGRFLNYSARGLAELPKNLTENRFNGYWQQTLNQATRYLGGRSGGDVFNEEARFDEVIRLIEENTVAVQQRRPQIGKAIAEHFTDGKWYDIPTIAAKVESPEDHVAATLKGMRDNKYYSCKCEQREIGAVVKYRIFREAKKVGTDEMLEKLEPLLSKLREEGHKNMATMSPPTVLYLTGKIQQQIDEWSGKPAKETGLRKVAF